MANSWSLESELTGLAHASSVEKALLALGLIDDEAEAFELATVADWCREGAETYTLHFSVSTSRASTRFVMKACVAYSPGVPLRELFAEWNTRRDRLRNFDVATPDVLVRGDALVIEEYIPLTLREALGEASARSHLVTSMGWTAGRITAAGFIPLSVHDWRSRGRDVVLIDFGQDLGPSGQSTVHGDSGGILGDVLQQLDDWGVSLDRSELGSMGCAYEDAIP